MENTTKYVLGALSVGIGAAYLYFQNTGRSCKNTHESPRMQCPDSHHHNISFGVSK